jgi:hypothetical protein
MGCGSLRLLGNIFFGRFFIFVIGMPLEVPKCIGVEIVYQV